MKKQGKHFASFPLIFKELEIVQTRTRWSYKIWRKVGIGVCVCVEQSHITSHSSQGGKKLAVGQPDAIA